MRLVLRREVKNHKRILAYTLAKLQAFFDSDSVVGLQVVALMMAVAKYGKKP